MGGVQALGLAGGWLVDQAAGDPRRGHPVAVFGQAAARLERRCWRDARPVGAAFAVVAAGVPTAAAWWVDRALARRGGAARAAFAALVVWSATGGRSLGGEARTIGRSLSAGELERARWQLPALVGRDPSRLDSPEISRAVVESVAENTADAVVGPLVWGALAGPAGVVAHRCVNTLDAMVGHRTPRHERFGWAAACTDDLMGWLPARLTAWLAALLAPVVGGTPARAAAVLRRDARRHPSPNAGPCEAAFAGALGVRLGGANTYPAPGAPGGVRTEVRGPLGAGRAPRAGDIDRAVCLSTAVGMAAALLCAGVRLLADRGRA